MKHKYAGVGGMSQGGVVVVKVGGAAIAASAGLPAALRDVAALVAAGRRVVVVHGGGPEITALGQRLGLQPRFVAGLRHTDAETLAVAEMALGRVGKAIAAALSGAGVDAVALDGRDARLLSARPLAGRDEDGRPADLGLVGEITAVRAEVLAGLWAGGLVPVVAPLAVGEGGETYNVNADDAAADVAAALEAACLCLATDVAGVLVPGQDAPLGRCDAALARRLIAEGAIGGGMRPKVLACLRAIEAGVAIAWIVDGRRDGAVGEAVAGEAHAGTAFGAAAPGSGPAAGAVREAYGHYVLPTYARSPLVLVRGAGARVWDAEGTPYLDFLCGIGVTNLGHCHPRVTAAIAAQARRLAHTSNLYHTLPQAELAAALVALGFPGKVFFCNSGAEANEGALKLSRKAAWRRAQAAGAAAVPTEILSFEHAFHGRTYGALAVTRGYQEGFGPMLPGFRELPWNDVAAAEAAIGPQTAGVIVEPVQMEGGVRPALPEFLARLRALCDRFGACLIFDEVQCGLGRAGRDFAFQHYGVVPDVVTLGKALGGGLPMGAVLARQGWTDALRPGDHATTFGGNPVVAAAGLAALEVLREQRLSERASRLGEAMRAGLRRRLADSAAVVDVRGLGLMAGIELRAAPGAAQAAVERARARGVLINATAGCVLRVLPPLTVEEADLEAGLEIIAAVVRDVTEGSRAAAG